MQINSLSLAMPKMAYKNPNIQTHTNLNKAHPTNQTNLQNPNFGMKFFMTSGVQKEFIECINKYYPGEMTTFVSSLQKLVKQLEPVYNGFQAIWHRHSMSHPDYYIKIELCEDTELNYEDMEKFLGKEQCWTKNNELDVISFDIDDKFNLKKVRKGYTGVSRLKFDDMNAFVLYNVGVSLGRRLEYNYDETCKIDFDTPQKIPEQCRLTTDLLDKINVTQDCKFHIEEYKKKMGKLYNHRQQIFQNLTQDRNNEEKNMSFLASITTN